MESRERVRAWFDDYVENHVPNGMKSHPMITLKSRHCRMVADLCRDIAAELGWSQEDVDTAYILGLLHDVGRISQVAEHNTFSDGDSFDHGIRGCEVVTRSGVLSHLPERTVTAVLESIHAHNKREIPPDTSPESIPFAKLVRDADKLDIYRVIFDYIDSGSIEARLTGVLNIDIDGPVSPATVGDIMRKETVNNPHIVSLADFYLMQLSWVFDINYRPTYRRISEKQVFERLAALLPVNDDTARVTTLVMDTLAEQIAELKP